MTIEDLAELSGEKLKALSDAELTEILKPYFNVTRPELAPRKTERKDNLILKISPEKRAALALLSEEGVDLSFLKLKRK